MKVKKYKWKQRDTHFKELDLKREIEKRAREVEIESKKRIAAAKTDFEMMSALQWTVNQRESLLCESLMVESGRAPGFNQVL